MSRTGERTPTGTERPSRSNQAFGWTSTGNGARFTRRERLRTEREATCFEAPSHRATGGHGRRSAPAGGRRSTPTAPEDEGRRRHCDDVGNRVSVNDVEGQRSRATGRPSLELRERKPGNRPKRAERHRHRATDVWRRGATEVGQPIGPGSDSGDGGRATGRRSRGGHCRRATGGRSRRQRGRATGRPAANGHRPPRRSGRDGRCDDRDAG